MRSLYLWMGLGVVSISLVVGVLGQHVFGQGGAWPPVQNPGLVPLPAPPPTPSQVMQPSVNSVGKDSGMIYLPSGPTDGVPGQPVQPAVYIPHGTAPIQQVSQQVPEGPPTLPLGPGRTPPSPTYMPTLPTPPGTLPPAAPVYPPRPSTPSYPPELPPTLPARTEVPLDSTLPAGDVHLGRNDSAVSTEWIGPEFVKLGQPITCQILVKNNGSSAVRDVVVRHRLCEGVQHRSSEPAATVDVRQLSWNIGTLEPGATKRIELQLNSSARGSLHCQATVTYTSSASLQVQVREPLLNIKVKGPERVVAGEPVSFQIQLSNPGDAATETVRIKAVLPEGIEHAKGRNLEMNVAPLQPKETRTMNLVCQAQGAGVLQVCFFASADSDLKSNDNIQVEVLQPRLDLVMAGPKLRYIDRRAAYSLKVANPGSAPANNVTVSEVIPAGFKFHSVSSPGRYDEATRTVTWTLGDVMPGQNREMSLELLATHAGDHKMVAQVSSARGIRTESEVHTRVEGLSSLVVDVRDIDNPVEVGVESTFEITVRNMGTKTESNLQLVCTLADQMEFCGARNEANLQHRTEGRDVVFEALRGLAPRASVVFRVHYKGTQPGNLRFRAQVRGDSLPEPIVSESYSRVYNDDSPAR